MMVQALRFYTNSLANHGAESGAYKNTYDNTEDEKLAVLVKDVYEEFERKRKEHWAAVVRGRNEVRGIHFLTKSRYFLCLRDLKNVQFNCAFECGAI